MKSTEISRRLDALEKRAADLTKDIVTFRDLLNADEAGAASIGKPAPKRTTKPKK